MSDDEVLAIEEGGRPAGERSKLRVRVHGGDKPLELATLRFQPVRWCRLEARDGALVGVEVTSFHEDLERGDRLVGERAHRTASTLSAGADDHTTQEQRLSPLSATTS
ncbi:MAG: hypothetical protein H0V55_03545 [Thermoleophilaceae bacterium]|nr:hypothetical protein [Thermoleophilaceae bacterium]